MPIDYSKWDNLEISDDSDIECHPNVDKRSMIRWRQQKIRQDRAERKANIENLKQFIPMEESVLNELRPVVTSLNEADACKQALETLQKLAQDQDKGRVAVDEAPRPGEAPLTLEKALKSLVESVSPKIETDAAAAQNELKQGIQKIIDSAQKLLDTSRERLEKLEREESRKLTSENIFHETSNRTILNKGKTSKPSSAGKKKEKRKEMVVETLNPGVQMKDLSIADDKKGQEADDEDEDDEESGDIELSKEAEAFAKIKGFEASYKHLQKHPEIITEKIHDQILAEAFSAQLKGEEEKAKNYVIQSLTLQYCGQLGSNGMNVFFEKMNGPNQQARKMFFDDVEKTYGHIQRRCKEIMQERQSEGVETIQLQTASEGGQITIRIPDPNKEEEQEAYKVFDQLPSAFKDALKTGKLEELNKVLEKMNVNDAETLIQVCSQYGFLDVGSEIIDQTQQQSQ